jgi:hypothetical protein
VQIARVSPVVSLKTPPRKPEAETDRDEWREEQDLLAQWEQAYWAKIAAWIALLAAAITGVGVIFVKRTLDATRDAVVEAAKASEAGLIASEAAKLAAEASVAAERARFFIVIDDYNIDSVLYEIRKKGQASLVISIVGPDTPPAVKYRFRNYGKTPAIIKEISLGMILASDPVDPVYSVQIQSFRENMIAGGDATEAVEFSYRSPLDTDQATALDKMEARLWFFGRVDYDDVFGASHTHRFYFRTVMWEGNCILQPYDYKHYNQST